MIFNSLSLLLLSQLASMTCLRVLAKILFLFRLQIYLLVFPKQIIIVRSLLCIWSEGTVEVLVLKFTTFLFFIFSILSLRSVFD